MSFSRQSIALVLGTDNQTITNRKCIKHKTTNCNTNKLALVKTQKNYENKTANLHSVIHCYSNTVSITESNNFLSSSAYVHLSPSIVCYCIALYCMLGHQ